MNKELKLFMTMNKVVNNLITKTNKIVVEYDITYSQYAVLEVLHHKGALSVGDVQEQILSSSGTIAVIIKNLVRNGLIVKLQDNRDRRKYILKLTEIGAALIRKVYPQNEEMITKSICVLNFKEQQDMLKYLKKITGYKND